MLKTLEHNPITTIWIVVLVMAGFSIQYLPVSIMEARNFITAREMLNDGHWLLTTMNGLPRYQKPPLPTWFSAISGLLFGLKPWALRLPAVLCIGLIGTVTFYLSKTLIKNTQHSLVNALIVVTSFYVVGIIIEAPWDIYTHGFMLASIYFLFKFLNSSSTSYRYILWAACFLGASVLSKGPIAIYALLLPFILAYAFTYKFKPWPSKLAGLLIVLVLGIVIGG